MEQPMGKLWCLHSAGSYSTVLDPTQIFQFSNLWF